MIVAETINNNIKCYSGLLARLSWEKLLKYFLERIVNPSGHGISSPDIVCEWFKEIPKYAQASAMFDVDFGVLY